jgi:hypothetical protein
MGLQFRCPSCGSSITTNFTKPGDTVKCPDCSMKTSVPEDSVKVEGTGKPFGSDSVLETTPLPTGGSIEEKSDSNGGSKDYSTLLTLSKLSSFLGWVVVVIGILMFFGGMVSGWSFLAVSLPGIGVSILGILVVAFGQTISCFVDTERHARASSETLKEILAKMNDTTEKDDTKDQG